MANNGALQLQDDLSEREVEIVELLADGLTNQEIANQTALTLYTIKWYLKQIYSKLHVSNRTQAAAKARELGLLDSDSSSVSIVNNLPEMLTPFFGRERELAQLERLLDDRQVRLITLHGIGGMGKTRLALEAARRFSEMFPDGVFLVSLFQFDDDPLQAVANTLRLPVDSSSNVLNELGAFLNEKRCLLVLDNFENVSAYAPRVTELLQRTQYLQVLVTSREILHVQGEFIFPLEGLRVPKESSTLEDNGAYQLYVQRARSVCVDFTLDEERQADIIAICKMVGGMPLAIELAAGWASVLTAKETRQRLRANLDLLASHEQDRPERQQSIRATFDYSWDLLSSQVQEVLVSLGVFHRDGFTLQAAETIAGATPPIIKQLLDTALLQRKSDGRFAFHPLIRQYVTERLQADAETFQAMRARHGEYYLDFVISLIGDLREEMSLEVVERFRVEMYNLNYAWFFALEQGYYDWLEAAVEVGYICEMAGLWQETDRLFATTLEHVPARDYDLLRGRLLAFRALFAFRFHDFDTMRTYAQYSWEVLQSTDYAWDAATAMCFLAIGEVFLGNSPRGFEILDLLEGLLEHEALKPNGYAASVMSCARPTALFFDGRNQEALPLLEKMVAPSWYESHLHLPECYIQLDMIDKARQILERLYNASLDHGNFRLTSGTVFYLTIIDSPPEKLLDNLVSGFIELTRMDIKYLRIAQINHYIATQLSFRGHRRWAKLLFRSNLHMLNVLGARFSMYKYALQTARVLVPFQPETACRLLQSLIDTPDCPSELQTQAVEALNNLPFAPDDLPPQPLLDVINVVLA